MRIYLRGDSYYTFTFATILKAAHETKFYRRSCPSKIVARPKGVELTLRVSIATSKKIKCDWDSVLFW